MILENQFSVGADIEATWRQLLDLEGVATCLAGAKITATDRDDVYEGSMRLKIGPMRVEYRGTATLSEVDETNHTALVTLSARESKGQGSALAKIRNRLDPVDGGTRVTATTELQITGAQAQFGRGVIEDVGKRVLDDFAMRLEQRITGSAGDGAGPSAAGGTAEPSSATAQVGQAPAAAAELDVGSLVTRHPAVRIALGALLLAVVAFLVRRRR